MGPIHEWWFKAMVELKKDELIVKWIEYWINSQFLKWIRYDTLLYFTIFELLITKSRFILVFK